LISTKVFLRQCPDNTDPAETADIINIEGTMQFLQELQLDLEDPVVLVLAYQLEAPSLGVFTRQGFVEGWKSMGYAVFRRLIVDALIYKA
jgi:DCN1-like protein 1/2